MHHNTKRSEKLQRLREEPRTDMNLPSPSSSGLRRIAFRLTVKSGGRGNSKSWAGKNNPQRDDVIYLYGDERRAVRKYIEANTEFVKACLEKDCNSPIQNSLPTELYNLMCEEYEIMKYNNEL